MFVDYNYISRKFVERIAERAECAVSEQFQCIVASGQFICGRRSFIGNNAAAGFHKRQGVFHESIEWCDGACGCYIESFSEVCIQIFRSHVDAS